MDRLPEPSGYPCIGSGQKAISHQKSNRIDLICGPEVLPGLFNSPRRAWGVQNGDPRLLSKLYHPASQSNVFELNSRHAVRCTYICRHGCLVCCLKNRLTPGELPSRWTVVTCIVTRTVNDHVTTIDDCAPVPAIDNDDAIVLTVAKRVSESLKAPVHQHNCSLGNCDLACCAFDGAERPGRQRPTA